MLAVERGSMVSGGKGHRSDLVRMVDLLVAVAAWRSAG